ncbi:hypothetical protein E2562_034152 [Oryza meyeriana var. granulata]|uniref:Uncharacterized protein n=1 Tax=Oryza meyeriana var. granulata TaxID=110450 RepID=A0A6G1DSW2_9ORYZ|nr:hypothetical protein E2562_034152 [Oryza meyeriana var. granulata]
MQPSPKHAEPACTPAAAPAMQPPKQDQDEHAESTTKPETPQKKVAITVVNAGEVDDDGSADTGRRCVCSVVGAAAGQPAGHFRCVCAETDSGDE